MMIDGVYKTLLAPHKFKQEVFRAKSMGMRNFIGNIPDEMNKYQFYDCKDLTQ